MTNVEGNQNIQMTESAVVFLSTFGIRHCFGIRHSSFVIPL